MNALPNPARQSTGAQSVLTTAARAIWQASRLSLHAVLTLLEPVVRAVFSLAMLLGIIAAIVFELSAMGPRFPFLEMLALSLGFGAALFAYYGLISLVSR
jgi:hypothetical protein